MGPGNPSGSKVSQASRGVPRDVLEGDAKQVNWRVRKGLPTPYFYRYAGGRRIIGRAIIGMGNGWFRRNAQPLQGIKKM